MIKLSFLKNGDIIDRLSFTSSSVKVLDAIAKSSPSCFIYNGLSLEKQLPHNNSSNLEKLEKILPNAAETIRNYYKFYFTQIAPRKRNRHRKISREDVILAFSSDEHIKVINRKIADLKYNADLPWEILGNEFSIAEYLFIHTLSLCKLIALHPYNIVGVHDSGIKLNGLYFNGPWQLVSKTAKNGYGKNLSL